METVIFNIIREYGASAGLVAVMALIVKFFILRDIKQKGEDISTLKKSQAGLEARLAEESRVREVRFAEIEGDVEMLKVESLNSLKLINQNIAGIQEVIKQHVTREERYQDKMDEFRGYVYRKLGPMDEHEK